jgi:hypothetical protein
MLKLNQKTLVPNWILFLLILNIVTGTIDNVANGRFITGFDYIVHDVTWLINWMVG